MYNIAHLAHHTCSTNVTNFHLFCTQAGRATAPRASILMIKQNVDYPFSTKNDCFLFGLFYFDIDFLWSIFFQSMSIKCSKLSRVQLQIFK